MASIWAIGGWPGPCPRAVPSPPSPPPTSAKAFYPLPPEPPYRRHSPRTKNFAPEFLGAVDSICGTPPPPPPGGLALFEEACALAGGVLIARDGAVVAETATYCGGTAGPFVWRHGELLARIWPLTPIRFVPGDSVYLQQAFDDNYARWLVEVLPRVAVAAQFVDLSRFKFAITRLQGDMGQSHARGSGPVRRQAGANRRDRSRSGYVRAAALSVARRDSSLGQVAKRHRGARISARQDRRGARRAKTDLRDAQRRPDPPPDQ